MIYAVVFEKSRTGYGAYVPDLPGCVAVGKTLDRVQSLIREAIEFHLEGMGENGEAIPQPTTMLDYVRVRMAGKRGASKTVKRVAR